MAQRYTAKRYISDRPSVIDGPEVYDEHAKLSTLYLGDLNIDSKGRVDELKGFFGTTRWDRIKILLVPHHGSSESWITGAASKFGHEESIFSAGKNYKKFPGLSVRKDLEATRLVDVNEDNGCRWGGVLEVDSETTRSIQEYIIGHMDDSVQPVCDSESLESLFQFIDLQDSDFS